MSEPSPEDPLAGLGPPASVGRRGVLSALGACAGLALFALAGRALWPVRESVEAIRRAPPEPDPARRGGASPVERDTSLAMIDLEIAVLFEGSRDALAPALGGGGSLGERVAALHAWAALRTDLDAGLARAGCTLDDYRAYARGRGPRPTDRLLLP